MKTTFSKSHLSYQEQIKLLKSRNLIISNEQFAIKKLQHLNYYRLSAYFYPFFEEKNRFKNELKQLFKKYPKVKLMSMGFVENWEENRIWRDDE